MTLSTEQLELREEIAKLVRNAGIDGLSVGYSTSFDTADEILALPALIAAAANRSTAGFGAEGVDQRGGVPAGWKLVPIEPTPEMSHAATFANKIVNIWPLMLAAAPKAPTTPDLEKLWPISTDGPHAISDARRWLARQLMDSRHDEATALGIVAYSPNIRKVGPTTPDLAVKELALDMLREIKRLYHAYVVLLETGRDRIIAAGGDCDLVDRMEVCDPALISARAAIDRLSRALAALGGDQGSVASASAPPSPTHESGCEPLTGAS